MPANRQMPIRYDKNNYIYMSLPRQKVMGPGYMLHLPIHLTPKMLMKRMEMISGMMKLKGLLQHHLGPHPKRNWMHWGIASKILFIFAHTFTKILLWGMIWEWWYVQWDHIWKSTVMCLKCWRVHRTDFTRGLIIDLVFNSNCHQSMES